MANFQKTLFDIHTKTEYFMRIMDKDTKPNLTAKQKDIATTLINDGWYGTFDELLDCVRNLSK